MASGLPCGFVSVPAEKAGQFPGSSGPVAAILAATDLRLIDARPGENPKASLQSRQKSAGTGRVLHM